MSTDTIYKKRRRNGSNAFLAPAQMNQRIEGRLEMLNRLHSEGMFTQENGIMPPLHEEEIRSYVREVLIELGKIKKT